MALRMGHLTHKGVTTHRLRITDLSRSGPAHQALGGELALSKGPEQVCSSDCRERLLHWPLPKGHASALFGKPGVSAVTVCAGTAGRLVAICAHSMNAGISQVGENAPLRLDRALIFPLQPVST